MAGGSDAQDKAEWWRRRVYRPLFARNKDILTIVVCAAILAAIAGAVGMFLGYEEGQPRQRDSRADAHASTSGQHVLPVCLRIPVLETVTCFANPQPSEASDQYAEDDLSAQQHMAKYAFWVAVISGIGVVITGAGVLFVALTLNATKDMVEEARNATIIADKTVKATREVGENQSRAYIHVSKAEVENKESIWRGWAGYAADAKPVYIPTLFLTFENVGQTPPKSVEVAYEFKEAISLSFATAILMSDEFVPSKPYRSVKNVYSGTPLRLPMFENGLGKTLGDIETQSRERQRNRGGLLGRVGYLKPRVVIRGRVKYRDVFNNVMYSDFRFSGYLPGDDEVAELFIDPDPDRAMYEPFTDDIDKVRPPVSLPRIPGTISDDEGKDPDN